MRHIFILLFFSCVSCVQQQVTKTSHLHSGEVFKELALPTPNSIRTASGAPGVDYWQQQADHSIQATLDVEKNMIHGSEKIVYHNNSPDTLNYIWFHLEQNTHRKDSIRSREGRNDSDSEYEGIIISRLEVE